MSELLLENLGNLNRIDKSLIMYNDRSGKDGVLYLGKTGITEKSRVEIDRITPHNFTTLMAKFDEDPNVGAIVVRAHGRQLCLVTKRRLYANYSYDYFLKFSDYAIHKLKMNYMYGDSGFLKNDRAAPIKTAISRCVKAFYDDVAPEGTRKKWDTVIIYKDENVDSTIIKRAEAQKGSIPVPGDKNYSDFVENLKMNFNKRCAEYLDKVRPDTSNGKEIGEYLLNRSKINKFKFKGHTYSLDRSDNTRVGESFNMIYSVEGDYDSSQVPNRIKLRFEWNGYKPYLSGVYYNASSYSYSSDWRPLETFGQ